MGAGDPWFSGGAALDRSGHGPMASARCGACPGRRPGLARPSASGVVADHRRGGRWAGRGLPQGARAARTPGLPRAGLRRDRLLVPVGSCAELHPDRPGRARRPLVGLEQGRPSRDGRDLRRRRPRGRPGSDRPGGALRHRRPGRLDDRGGRRGCHGRGLPPTGRPGSPAAPGRPRDAALDLAACAGADARTPDGRVAGDRDGHGGPGPAGHADRGRLVATGP